MKKPIVDIGIACSQNQTHNFWSRMMLLPMSAERSGAVEIGVIRTVSSALPDHNKNNIVGNSVKRMSLTDANRTKITTGFLDGKADYLMWFDDDTTPPMDTISRLVNSGRDFIGGLYFLPRPPYNPIAYYALEGGGYHPVYNYSDGALLQVDSIGMGCTLIHRSVYEKIQKGHTLFERSNGSLLAIPNRLVHKPIIKTHKKKREPYVRAGVYHNQVTPVDTTENRPWPFYQLEHCRTEDHYFCILAAEVGVKPWLDTTIACGHWKNQETTKEDYQREILGIEELE